MCGQGNQQQKQNQVYVETGTVSLHDASRKLQNAHIQSPEKPRCRDDKNCQSSQFMRPEKPNNIMQLKHPAVNIRKIQSDLEITRFTNEVQVSNQANIRDNMTQA